jgi:hypothetical protein
MAPPFSLFRSPQHEALRGLNIVQNSDQRQNYTDRLVGWSIAMLAEAWFKLCIALYDALR